jgi:hypothetical protein
MYGTKVKINQRNFNHGYVEVKLHAFSSLAQDEGKDWVHTRRKCCIIEIKNTKHISITEKSGMLREKEEDQTIQVLTAWGILITARIVRV